MSPKSIQIIGGGLAGLALGIRLRLNAVPVTVWEAGHYPRHRVCGEVLSGRGYDVLEELGLLERAWKAGARLAQTTAFFTANRGTPIHRLPRPALCLARYELDYLLAKRLRELGGELREGERWTAPASGPGIVRATGRPAQPTDPAGWRWFGLKAHSLGVELGADVEMHLLDGSYVGLCRLAHDRVNVCGLFRRSPAQPRLAESGLEYLRGPANSLLRQRLASAEWDQGSFCAVAGLPLQPCRAGDSDECRLGDALTMISPVTGNGMSMALEAADLAAPALSAYSFGQLDWLAARAQVAQACDARFAGRLYWASCLHRALFHPMKRAALLFAGRSPWAWRIAYQLTR